MTRQFMSVALCACSLAACTLSIGHARAATLQVGAGRTYTRLATAAAAARNGDTVIIYPGVYTQGAVWTANALTLEAAPGARLGAVVIRGAVNRKGIFDIKGDDVTVIGLEFEYARVGDANGAGIRAEGHNLTVRGCEFYANEMGMLITPIVGKQGGIVAIDASVFAGNGTTRRGYIGHAIYGNYIGALSVTNSTFRTGVIGHYIKSRALRNYVHGNTIDDTNGTASYLIDIAQGGSADIGNNVLIKGANADNCCIAISYGEEMRKGGVYVNPPGPVTITQNQFTNRSAHGVYFVHNASSPFNPVVLTRNTLTAAAGTIIPVLGPGTMK